MPGATTQERIAEALYEYLGTLTLPTGTTVVYPNNIYPQDGDEVVVPLLVVSLDTNSPERRRISGGSLSQHSGTFQVAVLRELGEGPDPSDQLAGLVAAHFPEDLELSSGSTKIRIMTAPHVAGSYEDRGRWRTPVNITYQTLTT